MSDKYGNDDSLRQCKTKQATEKIYTLQLALTEFRSNFELPVIQITMSRGRTIEQKRELVSIITKESARILKTRNENIRILIYEVEEENWADAGVLGLDMKKR
ncbi:MAG: tautomerase family protein [Nitrososphaeraceae archaeon]